MQTYPPNDFAFTPTSTKLLSHENFSSTSAQLN